MKREELLRLSEQLIALALDLQTMVDEDPLPVVVQRDLACRHCGIVSMPGEEHVCAGPPHYAWGEMG